MEYVIILVYFAALLAIGAAASRRVHDQRDYYVGGKNMGYWVVAFSARATGESAWLYLGLTGLGALVGVRAFWVVVGEVVGVALAWFFMAIPFKAATDRYGSITIPDYFASRFADSRFGSACTLRLLERVVVPVRNISGISRIDGVIRLHLGRPFHLPCTIQCM